MKKIRANRRQQRIVARRESDRTARTAAVPGVDLQTLNLPGNWRLAVLRHDYRDPRVLGREDEAIAHVRALAPPYACDGCGTLPNLLVVGVVDTPALDQIGIRCPACRSTAQGLYSDLAMLGTDDAMTDEMLRLIVQGVAQRAANNAQVMAKDATWFERNKGRRLRLRSPMSDMERGIGAPPAPGLQLLVLVRRDENPWRTPETMWAPAGMLRLDLEDTPAGTDGAIIDALIEAHFAFAAESPGSIDLAAIFRRAKEIHSTHELAAEAARAAARGEGGAA